MAQIRDYQVGVVETQTLKQIAQADGSAQFLSIDGVLSNAFSDLILYTDSGGASPIPGGVGGGNYEYAVIDTNATTKEAGTGGTGKTVYAQLKVTNATYQGIDLWATFSNFGTYTSNDAAFEQVGGVIEVTASGTVTIPEGYTQILINIDTDGGDIASTLSGGFNGQNITIKNTGSNVSTILPFGSILQSGDTESYFFDSVSFVKKSTNKMVFHIQDQKTAGVDGGTFTAGSWQTRALNAVLKNTIYGASLSSNQIILPAGAYEFYSTSPAFAVNRHKARLQNITDANTLNYGTSEYSDSASGNTTKSSVSGAFEITSSKTIELQHRCQATGSTNGFGVKSDFGVTEIYSDIYIEKIY